MKRFEAWVNATLDMQHAKLDELERAINSLAVVENARLDELERQVAALRRRVYLESLERQ